MIDGDDHDLSVADRIHAPWPMFGCVTVKEWWVGSSYEVCSVVYSKVDPGWLLFSLGVPCWRLVVIVCYFLYLLVPCFVLTLFYRVVVSHLGLSLGFSALWLFLSLSAPDVAFNCSILKVCICTSVFILFTVCCFFFNCLIYRFILLYFILVERRPLVSVNTGIRAHFKAQFKLQCELQCDVTGE